MIKNANPGVRVRRARMGVKAPKSANFFTAGTSARRFGGFAGGPLVPVEAVHQVAGDAVFLQHHGDGLGGLGGELYFFGGDFLRPSTYHSNSRAKNSFDTSSSSLTFL